MAFLRSGPSGGPASPENEPPGGEILYERDLKEALEATQRDQFFLGKIASGKVSHWELRALLARQDVIRRMDPGTLQELERETEAIENRSKTAGVWMDMEIGLEAGWQLDEEYGPSALAAMNKGNYQDLYRRKAIGLEKKHEPSWVAPGGTGAIAKLANTLEVLQRERLDQAKAFLKSRMDALREEWSPKHSLFSNNDLGSPHAQFVKIEEKINGFPSDLAWVPAHVGQAPHQPALSQRVAYAAQAILADIRKAKVSLREDLREAKQVEAQRPALEQRARAVLEKYIQFLEGLDPATLIKIERAMEKAVQIDPEHQPELEQLRRTISMLNNPHRKGKRIAEYQKMMGEVGQMPPAELLREVQSLEHEASYFQNLATPKAIKKAIEEDFSPAGETAKMASISIQEVRNARSNQEVLQIIERNLGKEHVEIAGNFHNYPLKNHPLKPGEKGVDLGTFTTDEGGMVFYQRGNEWKVIIDRDLLDKIDTQGLKDQVIHELGHVWLENLPAAKKEGIVAQYTSHPKWPQIKEAFLGLGKKPPYGTVFDNEGIVHELVAMGEKDIGKGKVSQKKIEAESDARQKALYQLNNLIAGSPALDIDRMRQEMQGLDEEAIIRGYEPGVDLGDLEGEAEAAAEAPKGASDYEKNEGDIDSLAKRISEAGNSPLISMVEDGSGAVSALKAFNEETRAYNRSIKRHPENSSLSALMLEERLAFAKSKVEEIETALHQAAQNDSGASPFSLESILGRTHGLSFFGLIEGIKSATETYKRRQSRKLKEQGERGVAAVTGKSMIGEEAAANLLSLEDSEVGEWKKRYDNLDGWQLEEKLSSVANSLMKPNKDQLKAILRALADKGCLEWSHPDLLRAVNRIQGAVDLTPTPALLSNTDVLRSRLEKALGEAYDYAEFPDLDSKNERGYDSSKKSFMETHPENRKTLIGEMEKMIRRKRAGDTRVDGTKYDSILDFCIADGTGDPEQILFYTLAGVAAGVIPPKRISGVTQYAGKWPAADWIGSIDPKTQARFEELCLKHFPKSYGTGRPSHLGEIRRFYFSEVINSPGVVKKSLGASTAADFDQDWIRGITGAMDAEGIRNAFGTKGGQLMSKEGGKENHMVAVIQTLEESSLDFLRGKRPISDFARMIGNMAMTEGIFSGNAYSKEQRSRYGNTNKVPSTGKLGNHPKWTVSQYRNRILEFLGAVDPVFFGMLLDPSVGGDPFSQKAALDNLKNHLAQNYSELGTLIPGLTKLDDVFSRLGPIAELMVKKNPAAVKKAIASAAIGKIK